MEEEEEDGEEGEAGPGRFAGSTGCWATGERLVSDGDSVGIAAELVCVRCQVSFGFGLSVFRKQNSFCLLLVT